MFLFTKSDSPERSLELLKAAAGERVECFAVGAKVYAIPAEINKGSAAKRLRERLSPSSTTVCAGDSAMDISLLRTADTAVFPEDLGALVDTQNRVIFPREWFCEQVTEYFGKILCN